ncbi:hypothetical protein DAMA08_026500 [Martiniozyma asiatica (nom. inval.)]|nr:hypothetical protein DAMA08_026500 [Martiniozyma asiatica]
MDKFPYPYPYPTASAFQKRSSVASERPFSHRYALASHDRINPRLEYTRIYQPLSVLEDSATATATATSNYTSNYTSRYPLYGIDWTMIDPSLAKIALSSYYEDSTNNIEVVHGTPNHSSDEESANGSDYSEISGTPPVNSPALMSPSSSVESLNFKNKCSLLTKFPVTRLQWNPMVNLGLTENDTFATTSECLRIYEVCEDEINYEGKLKYNNSINGHLNSRSSSISGGSTSSKLIEKCVLFNSKSDNLNQMPPMTSFDWNRYDPSWLITGSIDTTCTVWNLTAGKFVAKTQLIAHDSEVFDVKYIYGDINVFTSCSADGSVRLFDLRNLEQSTIIYEPPIPSAGNSLNISPTRRDSLNPLGSPALVRLSTCNYDANYIAVLEAQSNRVLILDLRNVGAPVYSFDNHSAPVNAIQWHPTQNILMTASDDCQVLIYDMSSSDISNANRSFRSKDPSFAFTAESEVNNICWSPNGDWIGLNNGKKMQAVKF